ncbi:hypothetical protein RUM44_003135 [Polyplax serrata]|uniref:TOM1-like protein 2 n=1 Tax=Polyplax serrata TaxID=468196 RepID=A0ABR1AZG4_POLSC
MALFFGVNPFSSPVGKKIEQATDASLTSENWTLNMEICDIINETEEGPMDAIKAIRKRLGQNASRNFTGIMYTLTVLETCVKNCEKRFIVLVCNKDFIQELVKLIGPKNDPPIAVQQKVLSLIKCWADAFKQQPEFCGVVQVYTELKQKGIQFPTGDPDTMALIHTPQKNLAEEIMSGNTRTHLGSSSISQSGLLTSDQLGKLTSELRVVEGNMTVLSEMLGELIPGKEPPGDLELLKELYTTCQAMQERLVELIGQLSNDEITAELLRVNDGLNNLFLRYSRYEKNRKSNSNEQDLSEGALIDFNVNEQQDVSSVSSQVSKLSLNSSNASSQLNSIPSVMAHNRREDEFDVFAQSRNISEFKADDAIQEGTKSIIDVNALGNQSKQPNSMHVEQDFDEMAAWLGDKDEELLTSSEFEKFLAERAAAAEALPSTGETNPSNPPPQKRQNKDSMFAL